MSHRKTDLGIPCPRKICQSSARACTHKRADVGFWGRSGNLVLVLSLTGFDPVQKSAAARLASVPRLGFVEERSDNFSRLFACQNGNDFKGCSRSAPLQDPFLEQSKIIAFHQLKAAAEVRLNPAINILQSARNHSAFITDALVDRQHVIVFEPFDDHEQHRLLRSFSTDEAYPEVAGRVSTVRNAGEGPQLARSGGSEMSAFAPLVGAKRTSAELS